ncbi:MAG: hypothetical protein N2444_05025 [Methylocystis sp.]|nr:hypothetical protein [Methylocystis sp.]
MPVFDAQILPGTRYKNLNSLNKVFDRQVLLARNVTAYRHGDALQFKNTFRFYRADRQGENVEAGRYNVSNVTLGGTTFVPNSLIERTEPFAVRHIHSLIGNRTEMFHQDMIFGLPTRTSAGVEVSCNDRTRNPSITTPALGFVSPYGFSGGVPYNLIPGATGLIGGARGQIRTVALFAENRTDILPGGAWMRRHAGFDTTGLVETGAWRSRQAASVYDTQSNRKRPRKADLPPHVRKNHGKLG